MPVFSKPASEPGVFQYTAEYLNNANNTVIHGGDFRSGNFTTPPVKKDGFEILQEHVATAAFHNSKQRVDPPRCHAHTREAVLEELFDWIVGNLPRETWIAWLNGAAGAGKSAICQSMAEICLKRGVKVASFFFFRTDPSRNSIDPVIATLAYQIIKMFPQTKNLIVQSIESDPLIFEQAFETQLEVLIVNPIRLLNISETLLFIVDGVDECTGDKIQVDLIHTISKLLQNQDLPLIVLFGSRRETQIQMAFNARAMDNILKQMPLDNNYQAAEDIHHFLVDCFDDIKLTHPLRKHLKPEWPSAEHVQEIVDKSSGQFVYASVVIKFVSIPSSSPPTQLDIVRGLRPAGRATPFAELDALYCQIFSQVEDITTVLRILAYRLFCRFKSLWNTSHFFNITIEDAESLLAALIPVLSCDADTGEIVFHHASLPDFLLDKNRSQEFCISEMSTDLTILWFKNAPSNHFSLPVQVSEQNYLNLKVLLPHAKASPDLRRLMLKYTPLKFPWNEHNYANWACHVLDAVQKIDFGDNGEVYCTFSDRLVRFVRENYPQDLKHIKKHFTTLTKEELKSAQELAKKELRSAQKLAEEELQSDYGPQPATTKRRSSMLSSLRPEKWLRNS